LAPKQRPRTSKENGHSATFRSQQLRYYKKQFKPKRTDKTRCLPHTNAREIVSILQETVKSNFNKMHFFEDRFVE